MTRVASNGRLVLPVAVDAPLHLQRLLNTHDLLRCHIAVTTHAFDLRCGVRTVAEEYKAGQLVDELYRDLPVCEIHMANLALRQRRKACPIRPIGTLVARQAFQLQGRVLLVIEGPVLAPQTQGKE